MAKYFYNAFGTGGDIGTKVPDTAQANGSVSYYAGYGSDYQLPLASGGQALPINRVQFNSLMNDVTGALQNIQQQGISSWIGPSPDSPPLYSGNWPYAVNALVYYTDGNIYQSLIASNTDTPGATANWLCLSANSGTPVGSLVDYVGILIPSNLLLCDGSSYNPTTYPVLFNTITSTQSCSANSTTTVTGLTSTAGFQPGFYVAGANVPALTTIYSVDSSTQVTLSAATTGTCSLLNFAPWGGVNNAMTTFMVPLLARQTTIGSGGSGTSVVGNTLASYTATTGETVTLTQANLPTQLNITIGTTGYAGTSGTDLQSVGGTNHTPTAIYNSGGGQATNIMQPSRVVYKCIKCF